MKISRSLHSVLKEIYQCSGAPSDLDTFLAEHLSFRAAAERLELTVPAVSHSIRQLEARLGVRLLNRTTRSVALTHAGIRLSACRHRRPNEGPSARCGLRSNPSPQALE
jgi:hypothetical protein